jgi:enterochelin esterase-like enzyme
MASVSLPGYAPGLRVASGVVGAVKKWHYVGEKRDLRLDLLRGFAAIAMIIDHMGGKDSLLFAISGGDRFFVSAAEGFVFISGLVMGIVYASLIARHGLQAALLKGMKRVITLYGLTVGLSLVFASLSFEFDLPWAPHLTAENFLDFVGGILTLHRAYYLTDVLLLYTLVVAAALPVLVLLSRGHTWLVLAGSWALWAAWQWWPDRVQVPWVIIDGNTFHFSSWQVLFITGLVIGYRRKALKSAPAAAWRARLRVPAQLGALALSALVVAGSIVLYLSYQANPGGAISGSALAQLFGKADVRAGRLAIFACLFVFAFLLSTFAWTPIKRTLGWLLLPIGQDALGVYTLHLFVLMFMAEATPKILGEQPYSAQVNTLVQAAAIAIVWGAAMAKPAVKALTMAVFARFRGWFSAKLDAVLAGRGRKRALRGMIRAGRLQRLSMPSLARPGFMVVAFTGIVLITAGPALAGALKHSRTDSIGSTSAGAFASPSQTVFPAETAAAGVSAQATPDFGMLVSGTAAAGPIATPTEPALPAYVQKRTFFSPTLNRVMPYYIYIPPGYDLSPGVRYPVLYMLHGISGTNGEWIGYGLTGRAYDMMKAGQISQSLIVLPEGAQGYWVDHVNGPAWGTYVAKDVVNEIDAHFRTLADRQYRAIGGLSMGGYGALELAITYPNVFGVAGAHSPSLHTFTTSPPFYGSQAYFDAHDPVYLYKAHPDIARTLKIWIDDGQDDDWMPVVSSFQQMLQAQGISDEWHVYSGGHEGTYWSTHVVDYLQFYSKALTGTPKPAPTPTKATSYIPPVGSRPASSRWGLCAGSCYSI